MTRKTLALGFLLLAVLDTVAQVGFKFGAFQDLLLMQKML